jgi:hypothetical protein
MRYRRAIEKIRTLAEACDGFQALPSEEPFLDLLDAPESPPDLPVTGGTMDLPPH